jgi:hypothetical protein
MLGDCSSELRAGDAFDISLNTASPSGLPGGTLTGSYNNTTRTTPFLREFPAMSVAEGGGHGRVIPPETEASESL